MYDAFGRRQSKTVNGVATQFLYDGLNPVQELSGGSSPTVTANMLTGLDIDEYFTRNDSNGLVSYLSDALGSTLGLVNSSGTLATSYSYDSFGATTASGAASANTYQFAGRENDGTGLYYYRARYYSPTLQRFISQDPLDFSGGGANLYAYVEDDATNIIDPSGQCSRPECDPQNPKNKTYLDFIHAHLDDSRVIAKRVDVPVQNILGLAGEESSFGRSRFATQGGNFFGLHAPEPGQIGSMPALKNPKVNESIFPSPAFLNSGLAFAETKGPFVQGVNDPDEFATILHAHGFGVGNPSYVSSLKNVIGNFNIRIDCP